MRKHIRLLKCHGNDMRQEIDLRFSLHSATGLAHSCLLESAISRRDRSVLPAQSSRSCRSRHPEPMKCHSERSKESCSASGRPPQKGQGEIPRFARNDSAFQSGRSCPSADGRLETMKYPGARASCPQSACNCGAKCGQDARAPAYLQSRKWDSSWTLGGNRRRARILRRQGYCKFSRSDLRMRWAVSCSFMIRGVESAGCGSRSKRKCSGIRTHARQHRRCCLC